jgi:hypothetical protein
MLFLMSQRGFANPAILGVVGAVVAGCTLFLYYDGNQLKSADQQQQQAASENTQQASNSDAPNFPVYAGSVFISKDTSQTCKNIDASHPSVPICETVTYIYSSPAAANQLTDWFKTPENTKPWTCKAGMNSGGVSAPTYCTNKEGDQFELMLNGSEIRYKTSSTNFDTYSYLPNWQTVFAPFLMYSYPQGWTLDDTGLKSPDYDANLQATGALITAGCVINGPSSNVADTAKSSQKFPFLSDPNAVLNSWQDPANKTFYWELKSKYKTVTLQSATKAAGDACQDTFWKYAKSIKMIENPESTEYVLLETN